MQVIIHTDQKITLEAAKLLGLPFTIWTVTNEVGWAFKFVPTSEGPALFERPLIAFEHRKRGWVPFEGLGSTDTFLRDLGTCGLYRVTFPDEASEGGPDHA